MKFKGISMILLSAMMCFNAVFPAAACPTTSDMEFLEADFIVPQGSTKISDNQFGARRDLIDVVIPKSVERIAAGAFYNCINLKSVIFEDVSKLKYIDDSVFQNCRNLERINLPDSIIYINAHCF